MRSGKVLELLKVSKPTLLRHIEEFDIKTEKLQTGENIFRWEHIAKLRYIYDFKNKVKLPVSILISQNKGGVGKTTSAVTLAQFYSFIGKTVLIDFEGQASSTVSLGVRADNFVFDVLDDNKMLKKTIINISPNLDLLPNNIRFEKWKRDNAYKPDIQYSLRRLVKDLKKSYDFIIIDTSPSLDISFDMSVFASDYCIIPAEPETFTIEGISNLLDVIENLKSTDNKGLFDLKMLGLFITKYEKSDFCDQMTQVIQDNYDTFETIIRKSSSLKQSQALKQSIFDYDESSKSCYDYYNLAFEILGKI